MKKDFKHNLKLALKHAKYSKFMVESNEIEGENRLNPDDISTVSLALSADIETTLDILALHMSIGEYLKEDWVGKFRTVQVFVGNYVPPHSTAVPELMERYVINLPHMNSWEAHNEFERIHPFQDLNGRVGRLIWLNKAVKEGYNFTIPFLQAYYYQTLENYK